MNNRLKDDLARILVGYGNGMNSAQTVDALMQAIDAHALMSEPPSKVAGYTPQPDAKVALVNEFKADEERLLRKVDALFPDGVQFGGERKDQDQQREQQRWRAIARSHFQEGFMALNRAVFQPQRIKLPEDGE